MKNLSLASIVLLAACASSSSTSEPRSPDHRASAGATEAARSDGEVVAVLATIDHGEIEQGRLAQSNATDADARAFGARMVAMHTESTARMSALARQQGITPDETDESRRLAAAATSVLQTLQGMHGADFDRAYIDAQVTQHTEALQKIDQVLLPRAQNPALRVAIRDDVRPMVAAHLDRAREIQSRMRSSSGMDAGAM
ncbi:MAG: DUF4142 domain-containing protein [Polyangiales bacterium]